MIEQAWHLQCHHVMLPIAESAFLCGRFSQLLRKKRVNLNKWSFGEDEESWWQMAWGCYKWKDKLCLIGLGNLASNWRTCDGRILTRRALRLLHGRYLREAMISKPFTSEENVRRSWGSLRTQKSIYMAIDAVVYLHLLYFVVWMDGRWCSYCSKVSKRSAVNACI